MLRIVVALLALLPDRLLRTLTRLLFSRTERELEAACRDPSAAQSDRLRVILEASRGTALGQELGLGEVDDPTSFRSRVPIHSWDDLAPYVDRMVAGEANILVPGKVTMFATTSGTTGRRKLIPVPESYRRECSVTNRVLFRSTLLTFPGLVRGKRLSMHSPGLEAVGAGAQAGSITVALSANTGGTDDVLDAVPPPVFRVKDFGARYYLCLRLAAQHDLALATAINPSTLLLFARTLRERAETLAASLEQGVLFAGPDAEPLRAAFEASTSEHDRAQLDAGAKVMPGVAKRIRDSAANPPGARMRDVFPTLQGLLCWKGGSAPWYLRQLKESYGDLPVLDYGYAASEGCFGAPLDAEGAASVLSPHGHFLEFVEEERMEEVRTHGGPTLLLSELVTGQRYYVLATTSAGLLRYDMNDVIEVVGHHGKAPLVVFRRKGGAMSSLTGEKLGEAHVVQAMAEAGAEVSLGADVVGFVVSPLLPVEGKEEAPCYLLAIDLRDGATPEPARLQELASAFDRALCSANEEYEAKRKSLRLGSAVAGVLAPRAFDRFRAARVASGAPDAHVKIPHLSPDGSLVKKLGLASASPELEARLLCAQVAVSSEQGAA